MNSKGDTKELVPELLVGLIIIVFITILLMGIVNNFVKSSRFESQFLANDLTLLIDTMYASPNEISLRYPQVTSQFAFSFSEDGKVAILDEDGDILAINYFTPTKGIEFQNITLEPTIEIIQDEDETIIDISGEGFVPIQLTKDETKFTIKQAISIFS